MLFRSPFSPKGLESILEDAYRTQGQNQWSQIPGHTWERAILPEILTIPT